MLLKNKIDQIFKIQKLEKDKKSYKISTRVLIGVIIISWAFLLLYFFIIAR